MPPQASWKRGGGVRGARRGGRVVSIASNLGAQAAEGPGQEAVGASMLSQMLEILGFKSQTSSWNDLG